jgi:hypothetical protein
LILGSVKHLAGHVKVLDSDSLLFKGGLLTEGVASAWL